MYIYICIYVYMNTYICIYGNIPFIGEHNEVIGVNLGHNGQTDQVDQGRPWSTVAFSLRVWSL